MTNKSQIKCDEYCCHDYHPFIYKLSSPEKEYIQKTAHTKIYMNKDLPTNKEKLAELAELSKQLNNYFNSNPTKHYFLKLNKLSPKDAYYIITNDSNLDDESELSLDDIKRDLDILHVGLPVGRLADYCINILLNSDRVYCELAFSDVEEIISVLLLDYKNINHQTETRIYVKNNKLIGISQYYCDLNNVYVNSNQNTPDIANIPDIIKKFLNIKTNLTSYVCDIYFDNKLNPELIELNPFTHSTDSCLFDWDTLELEPLEFRYKENNSIKKISFI